MKKELDLIDNRIIEALQDASPLSSSEIHQQVGRVNLVTIKRRLTKLVESNHLSVHGIGRATRYEINPSFRLFAPISQEEYFRQDVDDREIIQRFEMALLEETLKGISLFNESEMDHLKGLQQLFQTNVSGLPETLYKQEMERLAIDLSWKSSQIEGNTYTLLETELLIKERREADGKAKADATMLLNHKEAIDYVVEQSDYINPLTVAKIEDLHSVLIKDLGIDRNIRQRLVGITGTNYLPLDNEFQIREALEKMCLLINERESVFEKALLALILISYIQPFADGNKRTARILGNAILLSQKYCPLSFRTVDSLDYKKAMLLFYEQHNITAFKKIFITQYEFAVKNYFR